VKGAASGHAVDVEITGRTGSVDVEVAGRRHFIPRGQDDESAHT
jgi:hypothetical protein